MSDRGKRYDREFKDQAVRLAGTSGRPRAQVARELGVGIESLSKWVREATPRTDEGPTGATVEELQLEVGRLQKELRAAREEQEILGKAVAFFARNRQ